MKSLDGIKITEISEIITVLAPTGRHLQIKNRPFFGLSFCIDGKITYTHNGKKFVSDSNCAIFLPKNATYELYNNSGGAFPLINFKCTEDFTDEFITIPLQQNGDYIKDFEKMHELDLPRGNLKAMSIFYDILDRLSSEQMYDDGAIKPALKYITENLYNPELNNDLIASSAGISESYMRRLFKRKYGKSPKQYILEMRIKKAGRLLCETAEPVTDISYECGFSSVYHFCREFKVVIGITPTEYRKHRERKGI